MTKRDPHLFVEPAEGTPLYWRSLEAKGRLRDPDLYADCASEFDDGFNARLKGLEATGGEGPRVLAEPFSSPSAVQMKREVATRFPKAKFYHYSPTCQGAALQGAMIAFGEPVCAVPQYAR